MPPAAPASRKPKTRSIATAESMASMQREISVSEFFAKNRHLLGFDNPRKAVLTTVKEAVDNALDACEEAGILPTITVTMLQTDETRFKITVQDNGPGIVRKQIENIFGKLLYGSKFHRMKIVSRPARHRHFSRRHVWADDHGQARQDHLQDRQAQAVPRGGVEDRHVQEPRRGGQRH